MNIDDAFQIAFQISSLPVVGWRQAMRVRMVLPLTKIPLLRQISTLRNLLILMLKQRKKKQKVVGMNLKTSIPSTDSQPSQRNYLEALQEGQQPQLWPLLQDLALPPQRRCRKDCVPLLRLPQGVRPGEDWSGASSLEFLIFVIRRNRKSRSLDGRPKSPEESTCPICLGEVKEQCLYKAQSVHFIQVENKSMTDSCMHKFCFTCLQEWSKVKAECPLCKGKFSSILYNIRWALNYNVKSAPDPFQVRHRIRQLPFATTFATCWGRGWAPGISFHTSKVCVRVWNLTFIQDILISHISTWSLASIPTIVSYHQVPLSHYHELWSSRA